MRNLIISLAILCAVGLAACNIINPTERVPFYIKVDSVSIYGTNYVKYGSTKSHRITDVWVYSNNSLVGAYEVPATIPILADSNDVISIRAGINDNGVSNAKKGYDLYNFYSTPISWSKSTIKTLQPSFTYLDATIMPFNWDFESTNPFLPRNAGIDLNMDYSFGTANTFEGVGSGYLKVDTFNKVNQIVSTSSFSVPINKVYYLEMNYKCTMPFQVYVIGSKLGQISSHFLGGVNAKNTWNKIYFNIGALQSSVGAESFQLLIRSELPKDSLEGEMCLDNIKLIGIN
ncbi:MAG: hypothetical protein RL660_777 [Bacteroidota bacterium]